MGGYLPMYDTIKATPEAQKTPIRYCSFSCRLMTSMFHGTMDHKVPYEFAQQSAEIIKSQQVY